MRALSLRHLTGILTLTLLFDTCLIFSLADQTFFAGLFHNHYAVSLMIITTFALFLIATRALGALTGNGKDGITQALVILAVMHGAFLWPRADKVLPLAVALAIVSLAAGALVCVFRSKRAFDAIDARAETRYVWLMVALYACVLYALSWRTLHALSFFNSKDFAIYNQTFWNTVHGRFFENSTYGSNLSCHNTWFFLLLVPFYFIVPRPETLLALKIAFLALAALPYHRVIKDILTPPARLVMTAVFLLFPFLIAGAFTPPHEIGFAPAVILLTYYFFRRGAFGPFALSLIIMLSIKEHLALVALAFGIFAFFSKKGPRWVLLPVLAGIFWAGFSYAVITHFQKTYQSGADASWFLANFKRMARHGDAGSLRLMLERSNISSWFRAKPLFLLFAPLGFIVPVISPVCLLGFPEFALNLLADRSSMFTPQWHYNIVVSVFLLISCAEGIRKISHLKFAALTGARIQLACAIIILSLTLIHAYTWLPLARVQKSRGYAVSVRRALAMVPSGAFVTVPQPAAILISNRPRYSLLETCVYGDYVLTDQPRCLLSVSPADGYTLAYAEDGICLYKK